MKRKLLIFGVLLMSTLISNANNDPESSKYEKSSSTVTIVNTRTETETAFINTVTTTFTVECSGTGEVDCTPGSTTSSVQTVTPKPKY